MKILDLEYPVDRNIFMDHFGINYVTLRRLCNMTEYSHKLEEYSLEQTKIICSHYMHTVKAVEDWREVLDISEEYAIMDEALNYFKHNKKVFWDYIRKERIKKYSFNKIQYFNKEEIINSVNKVYRQIKSDSQNKKK